MQDLNVTVEDVLKGEKSFQVEKRDGSMVTVKVKALSWRAALGVSQMAINQESLAVIHAVQHGLAEEQSKDEFLNALLPVSITQIANAAMLLSNGVTEAKKRAAAGQAEGATATTSPQPSPTTLPSNVS